MPKQTTSFHPSKIAHECTSSCNKIWNPCRDSQPETAHLAHAHMNVNMDASMNARPPRSSTQTLSHRQTSWQTNEQANRLTHMRTSLAHANAHAMQSRMQSLDSSAHTSLTGWISKVLWSQWDLNIRCKVRKSAKAHICWHICTLKYSVYRIIMISWQKGLLAR